MNLERQRLAQENPELWEELDGLPRRLFSGKLAGEGFEPIVNREGELVSALEPELTPGIFCAYRMPALQEDTIGEVRWYFREAETGRIHEELAGCWAAIRCRPETSRKVEHGVSGLVEARKAIEKHIKNTYLKATQAPIGAQPTLIAWMEIVGFYGK
jgi:hypothetical protein